MLVKTKKWGNSLGVIIPNELVKKLSLEPEQEINLHIDQKNILKELFGFGKNNKFSKKEFEEFRRELEPRI